jgi:pantoate--beta-alanine ligase
VPTVRAADGLALSSRNKYLSTDERAAAPVLHRALAAGAAAAPAGPTAVVAAARETLEAAARSGPGDRAPRVDYLALVDARSYQPVPAEPADDFAGDAVLAIAARVGTTRLIDNVRVRLETDRHAADH